MNKQCDGCKKRKWCVKQEQEYDWTCEDADEFEYDENSMIFSSHYNCIV